MKLKSVKLHSVHGIETGKTKSGNDFKKQTAVFETDGKYPKMVAMTLWDDRVDELAGAVVGELFDVDVSIESREYNGKWYTNVNATAIGRLGGSSIPQQPINSFAGVGVPISMPPLPHGAAANTPHSASAPTVTAGMPSGGAGDDDFPF